MSWKFTTGWGSEASQAPADRGKARPHARTRARPIYRNSSYKVTKRCLERRLFPAPGRNPEQLVNSIGYCLAYTAAKYGIQIHAAIMMSNHYHVDLTDPSARSSSGSS